MPATIPASTPVVVEPGIDSEKRLNQSFAEACSLDAGDDQLPPPAITIAGKSTGVLREAVEKAWPIISLIGDDGKPRGWTFVIATDLGDIEIELRPTIAPNHVRNLIALVKTGYYDGLRFDRIVRQAGELPDGTPVRLEMVRFGCPAGTGDPGIGHLGYHLKSEFSDAKHEPGTVGFVRDDDPSSGGVRLYITTAACPILDGNLTVVGQVARGMEVVQRIAGGEILPPDADPSREMPVRPVVIRKATVQASR